MNYALRGLAELIEGSGQLSLPRRTKHDEFLRLDMGRGGNGVDIA